MKSVNTMLETGSKRVAGIVLAVLVLFSMVGAVVTVSAEPQSRGAGYSLSLYSYNYQPGDNAFTIYGHLKNDGAPISRAQIFLQYWDGSKWQPTTVTPTRTNFEGYYSFRIHIPSGGLANLRTYAGVGLVSNVLGINVSTPGLH